MIRNILLLAATSLAAMYASAQDATPADTTFIETSVLDTIPATAADTATAVEMLDEANIYDDERDQQIDSLRQAVAMLQSQLDSQQQVEKPRDFDPFGQTGFAHLWLQYD